MRAALLLQPRSLEQQHVIELPDLQLIQPQFFRYLKPDPATAQAMPLRLALGDVESMAQRTRESSESRISVTGREWRFIDVPLKPQIEQRPH